MFLGNNNPWDRPRMKVTPRLRYVTQRDIWYIQPWKLDLRKKIYETDIYLYMIWGEYVSLEQTSHRKPAWHLVHSAVNARPGNREKIYVINWISGFESLLRTLIKLEL